MNKRISLLAAALLLCGASSTFAASSTDLTVTGVITPAACTPSLANGGVVDYGKISAKDLKPTIHTQLNEKAVQLSINCDAPTSFAILTSDNRENTASIPNPWAYGLGKINADEKLGWYSLKFVNPVAEISVAPIFSRNNGEKWDSLGSHITILKNDWVAFGNRVVARWTPDPLQNVTVDVMVSTNIAPADNLTLTDEVSLDGSATLQIKYL